MGKWLEFQEKSNPQLWFNPAKLYFKIKKNKLKNLEIVNANCGVCEKNI